MRLPMTLATKNALSAQRAREALEYDPETGVFKWKIKTAQNVVVGRVAGGVCKWWGYRLIRVDKVSYRAHRIAWLYMTGEWPADEVDHINGHRADNRWCNLRAATVKQNRENRAAVANNTSGLRGVSWVVSRKKWLAQIKTHGKNRNLGRFDSMAEAVAARRAAELELFTHHRMET